MKIYSLRAFIFVCGFYSATTLLGVTPPPAVVVAWGDGSYHESDFPPGIPVAMGIAAGGYHSLVLRTNGTVLGWGADFSGQIDVPGDLANVTAIEAGQGFSLALKGDGTIVGWGRNVEGQLNVPASVTNALAVAAGMMHAVALRSDGTVVSWGDNSWNQLNVPPGQNGNLVAIDSGALHNLGLRNNGTVLAWGWSQYGQTNVPAGLASVAAVAAGSFHSLALRSNGTVVAWGDNTSGQCNVPAGLSGVVAIAGGDYHSLALKSDGTVVGWGGGGQGQLSIPTWLTGVVAIVAGDYHSIALTRAPVIVGQPASVTVVAGSDATFGVQAIASSALSYQWKFQGTNLPGATDATLFIANAQAANAGSYTVVVSNPFGSVTSAGAGLVVNYPPLILDQPTNQTVSAGRDVDFVVRVSGTPPFAYQWRFESAPLSGETGTRLAITNVQASVAGSYDVVISNVAGVVTSSSALLTVTPAAPEIILQPAGVNARAGTDVVFTVIARGSEPFAYQWLANGVPRPGATGASLSLVNVQAGDAADYSLVVANGYGSVTSEVATLSVVASGPFILVQPATQVVPVGTNVVFQVVGRGTEPLAFRWKFQGVDLVSQGGPQLTLSNVQPPFSGTYTVSISNSLGAVTSTPAYLVMPPVQFTASSTNTVGVQPIAVAVADFNHDAKPDVATVDRASSSVSILLGKGNGTFFPRFQFPVGNAPVSLDVADFNRDGHPDIVTANAGGNSYSVLRGTTNGTFTPGSTVSIGFSPSSVRAGDFNGDGKPDLALANYFSSLVHVMLGTTNGSFSLVGVYLVDAYPTAIAVADLNQDGKLDLVTANDLDNSVSVLLGNGDGSFALAQNLPLGISSGRLQSVAVGDFNRDGNPDIATGNGTAESVGILQGLGGGNFAGAALLSGGSGSLVISDFNGDTIPDIAVSDDIAGDLKVFLGVGNGAFAPSVSFTVGQAPQSIAAGDFNLDGKPDLAVGNFYAGSVTLLLNGSGALRPTLNLRLAAGQAELSWAAFGAGGFLLERTTNAVVSNAWVSVTNQTSTSAGVTKTTLPVSGQRTFFRLRKP